MQRAGSDARVGDIPLDQIAALFVPGGLRAPEVAGMLGQQP